MLEIDTGSSLQKMNLMKQKKSKNVNTRAIYMKIFLNKKKTKDVNVHVKNIETFLKKKETKSFNFLQKYKKVFLLKIFFFSSNPERAFQGLGK